MPQKSTGGVAIIDLRMQEPSLQRNGPASVVQGESRGHP